MKKIILLFTTLLCFSCSDDNTTDSSTTTTTQKKIKTFKQIEGNCTEGVNAVFTYDNHKIKSGEYIVQLSPCIENNWNDWYYEDPEFDLFEYFDNKIIVTTSYEGIIEYPINPDGTANNSDYTFTNGYLTEEFDYLRCNWQSGNISSFQTGSENQIIINFTVEYTTIDDTTNFMGLYSILEQGFIGFSDQIPYVMSGYYGKNTKKLPSKITMQSQNGTEIIEFTYTFDAEGYPINITVYEINDTPRISRYELTYYN